MSSRSIHPKAFLLRKRNVKAGLEARTRIISRLEVGPKRTREICKETGFSFVKVAYHLRSLLMEKLVAFTGGKRPHAWFLTEYGQQRLEE